jgi:hypothetical protein
MVKSISHNIDESQFGNLVFWEEILPLGLINQLSKGISATTANSAPQ